MKRLTLLRHAKSSWKDPTLADFDRPLNRRGQADAPRMGQHLAAAGRIPQRILASPARRARKTAKLVAAELGLAAEAITCDPRLYEADAVTLLNVLQAWDDGCDDLLLVGHNPGLTELANLLGDLPIANVVTCGAVALDLAVASWRELGPGGGRVVFYDYPKKQV